MRIKSPYFYSISGNYIISICLPNSISFALQGPRIPKFEMRLVGCLLLPTDIRACLYEPGMGEGSVQARVESRPRPGQAHHPGQPPGPLVVRKPRHVVHSHRLIWQHAHTLLQQESVLFDSSFRAHTHFVSPI
ncbi:unnamed protein product [Colias eurytheme]|nr:unnamed protein product [Colias eurytheme]